MSAVKNKNSPEMSTWGFFGYKVLYAIPIIGTFFMIYFALDNSNPTRRNFTRAYFIPGLIYALLIVGMCIFALVIYAKNGWL